MADAGTPLHELPIATLQARMAEGALTARALTQHYLDRIARIDRDGPRLNAVRELNPQALAEADAADAARAAGQTCGRLHGIPVLLKDNIATAGMACAAGSLALATLRPHTDAHLVSRLRAAGAVILGKANLTEFADYLADVMPAEFSAAGGVVRHPYGQRYGRGGGSSIGPACAVAAGLCAAAVGSETQNSLQTPARDSAVVAIKPTVGLVSRAGIVPLAISQDTAGPMARSVADAAAVLDVLAGADLADTLTLPASARRAADYALAPDPHALQGARIGVPRRRYFDRDGAQRHEAVTKRALATLREAGAIVVDPADIPSADTVAELRSSVFPTEFRAGLNAFLASMGSAAPVQSLAEVIAYNTAHADACLVYGQVLAERAEASAGLDAPAYRSDRLRDITLSRELGIDAALRAHGLDALVTPAGAAAKMTGKAGYPVVTVPAGFTNDGEPAGISFIGAAWSERRLIALATAYERAGPPRTAPALD